MHTATGFRVGYMLKVAAGDHEIPGTEGKVEGLLNNMRNDPQWRKSFYYGPGGGLAGSALGAYLGYKMAPSRGYKKKLKYGLIGGLAGGATGLGVGTIARYRTRTPLVENFVQKLLGHLENRQGTLTSAQETGADNLVRTLPEDLQQQVQDFIQPESGNLPRTPGLSLQQGAPAPDPDVLSDSPPPLSLRLRPPSMPYPTSI